MNLWMLQNLGAVVVSKVAAEHKTYEQAMAGIDETLKKMGLYYQDFCRVFCILNFQLKYIFEYKIHTILMQINNKKKK